jgi:hypothetical protein
MEHSERHAGTEFMRVVRRRRTRKSKGKHRLNKPKEFEGTHDISMSDRKRYGAGSVLIPTGDFGMDDKDMREVLEEIYSSTEFSSAESEKGKAKVAILSWKERILESEFWKKLKGSIAECLVRKEKEREDRWDKVSFNVLGIGSLIESGISQCQFALCLILSEFIKPSTCTIFDPILVRGEYELADDLGGFRNENVLEHALIAGDDSKCMHFYVLLHCDRSLHEAVVTRHLHALERLCCVGNSLRAYVDADAFSCPALESDGEKRDAEEENVIWKVQRNVQETHLIAFKPLWNAFNDTYIVQFTSTSE